MKPRWTPGCLWGCGLGLLVAVAIVGSGTWYAWKMTRDFKEVKTTEQELVAATAPAADFVPAHGGLPVPADLEAFCAVREQLTERRAGLERAVAAFKATRAKGGWGPVGLVRMLRAGTDVAPVYAGYWSRRNRLLREHGLGPGQYAYLYRLIYQGWLGHDPADGVSTPAGMALAGGERPAEVSGDAAGASPGDLAAQARTQARDRSIADLERIARSPAADSSAAPDPWAQAVAAELAALESDPERRPWQDGVPAVLDQVLAPFRSRLERTYSEMLNPIAAMFTTDAPQPAG